MSDHHWITVGDRRWCLTCSGFQARRGRAGEWYPPVSLLCTRDTPYAERELQAQRTEQ